jgi:eukaryotic-like serine/threonine-protein kinase
MMGLVAKQVETLDASVSTPEVRGRETGGIARGDRIGKYVIGERIGRGGMGVVYTARDERLGRDVAIKLAYASGIGSLGRAEREAQALAKLSHPNVVTVYEVGEHAGRLFVVMEYVAGGTARTWLAERTRSWREIVAMYTAAGAGLAAAHAAGIVHRDFKPDNVLVGNDSRPRVADFGLALASGTRTDTSEIGETPTMLPDGTEETIASGDNHRLTETGTVVGTPAYMAPEQLRGADADARVDQFALCVAMWEALYGVRPFEGRTKTSWEALEAAYAEPPKTSDAHVPRHVATALRRGLSLDPAARWPTVDALLAALSRDRSRERWLIAGGVAVLALGATGVTLVQRGGDPCAKAAGEIDSVWNGTRAIAMHAGFVAQGVGDAWPGVADGLDHYADEWADAERASCKAARDHSQPEDFLDARSACVYRARSAFGAVTDALMHADRAGVATAADQVRMLPQVTGCENLVSPTLPADPRQRFRVIVLEAAWLAVQAEIYAHVAQPKSELEALDAASTAGLEHTHVRVMAAAIRGRYELASGDPSAGRADFDTAIQASLELGDEHTAATLMTDMADSYLDAGQIVAAKHWTKLVEGVAHHLNEPPDLESEIAGLQARTIEHSTEELHNAAALRRRQVELSRKAWHDQVNAVIDEQNLAFAARDDDDPAAMNKAVDDGIALVEKNLGIDHPMMIYFESIRTMAAMRAGKLDDAERYARHAIALAEHWYGPGSVDAVTGLQNLSAILQRRGDIDGSMKAVQQALAAEIKRDPDGEEVGHLEGNLGIAYATLGDFKTAAPHLARATAIVEHLLGPDADPLNELYVAQSYVARGLGQLEDSRQLLMRSLALADKANIDRVNPRVELSYTLVLMHRAPEAVTVLDSVGTLVDSPATEPRHSAEYHLALADALWNAGNHARAIAEATKSRDAWAALGPDFVPNRDEAAQWLRKHP